MAEEIVITKDQFGRDVTIPIDENGNIILYRATDDPNRIIDSDFRPLAKDKGSVGLGQQSYFSPNPMYSHKYESLGRKNYKFITDIKPNQILATDFPVNNYPELVKVLNIPEEYTNQNWRQLVNNDKAMIAMGYEAGGKRFFNDNIQTFKDNGIKAFGSVSTGTGGQPYIEYEIIPLVKEGDTLGIKPIATLQTKEGFDAGKSPEAFIETSLDTPTNVAGAEVIDEGVDITESSAGVVDEIEKIQQETVEKLRISNDAFVDQQLDDIMARKINEVLPFVDTSISRADAIGIAITGPQVLDSADPVLNSFIKEIEQLTGQSLQTSEKRKLREFIYDMARGKDNLLDDKKSFISNLRDGLDNSKLKDPGYKIWKNWQNSGAFIPENLLGRTVNEFSAFGPPSYVLLLEGLEKSGETINYKAISDTGLEVPDTPTNVVDDIAKQNELINNFVNSMKTEGNLEFYVKHSGTEVPASSIQYNSRIGIGSQIPGFYTEPLGIRDIKTMGGRGGPNAISNYYKVQVNSNNLLISAGGGKVTGAKSPISNVGNANLGNQIEKIDWKIFEQETGLSWENDFNGKSLFSVERGEKVLSSDSQGFIRRLRGMGLTDDQISSALRKSGIEGFVSGPTNAQYEVVLLDPNDELGIGKNINVQDATKTDFVNNQSKVNQIDELITDTPTNVAGDEFVDNIVNANTQLVNDLPLSETVKNQFDNVVKNRAKNLATPGGVVDAVDVWELSVLGLMITAIAYKEFDEIPTIFKRTATNMFNSMTSMYNIPPVPLEQYDLDYEFIEKVITTGEKVMPTDIIIKKVGEAVKSVGEQSLATGFGYVPTTPKNTDTMETTQKIQPGVQEEKMFEQLRPKKTKSAGGSGARIQ